jgi:phage baseplate assembly protein W
VNNDKLIGLNNSDDQEAVKNSLRNIFLVQKNSTPGKPWFGNPLDTNVFDLFDTTTEETIESAIKSEIGKFEPRVKVTNLNVELMPEFNRIIVELQYETQVNNKIITDTLYMPFNHNNHTFMGGRTERII